MNWDQSEVSKLSNELRETRQTTDQLRAIFSTAMGLLVKTERELKETRQDLTQLEELVSDYRREGDKTARQLEKLQAQVDAPAKIAKDYDRLLEQLEKRCYHAECMAASTIKTSDETAATSAREIEALKEELGSLRAELDSEWRAAAPRKSALELCLGFADRNMTELGVFSLLVLLLLSSIAADIAKVLARPEPAKISQAEAKAY